MRSSVSVLFSVFVVVAPVLVAGEEISFNRDIRPILSDRCFKCHGPDAKNQKSDFRLDTEEHAHANLGGRFGILPGNLEKSEVHHLIHSDDEDEVMPPKDSNLSLNDHEKELLDSWIKQGAKFDKHWSLKPLPESVPVPEKVSDWSRNEIDRFVEAGFVKHAVKPSAEIAPEKWLRRVSFDLTGLPPTTAEIAAFLADTSPDACEKVVDRLLNSSQYAERMTSEWLDVARYSDSYGYQRDRERFVWPWRDWVIKSFSENMPYDRFATLQIAGDLLPDASPETILPTAFNRLHGHEMEGGIVLEEYRMEYISDRVHTFSSTFLGLTMECARCHDHKYDPLPTRDFYSLGAFFAIFGAQLIDLVFAPEEAIVRDVGHQLLIVAAVFQIFDAICIVMGGALRGAGEIIRYLLRRYSSIPVDERRWREHAQWLDQYLIDAYLDEPTEVWDWIARALLPILPVHVRRGQDGLWLQPIRWDATERDAVDYLVAGREIDRVGVVKARDEVYNAFALDYALVRGRYYSSRVLTAQSGVLRPGPAQPDARVIGDLLCRRSQERYGLQWAPPMQTGVVHSSATALRILRDQALQYATRHRTARYVGGLSLARLEPGSIVHLTDAAVSLSGVAMVDDIELSVDEVALDLVMLDGD